MHKLTPRERLERCYFHQETDRPGVYVRRGWPKDDPTYDPLIKLVDERTDLKFGWSLKTPPAGIRMELEAVHGAPGVVVSLDSPFVAAAARAVEEGFGRSPVMIREGGSIPIVTKFCETLNVDALLLGWGLDDDNTHSPNEKFSLADFHRGIKAGARLLHELSRIEIEPAE